MRALIVEDEPALMDFLCTLLTNAGLVVDRTASIDAALSALRAAPFDIAVIDRRLPDGDGLSIVKAMSAQDPRPAFLLLTARDAKADVVEGLNGGADDYLVKPFEPDELLARLRVIARRRHPKRSLVLAAGNLSLDLEGRSASVGKEPLELRRREALILEALVQRAGRVVTRDVLIEAVYGFDDLIESNTLEAQISRLRRKLRDAGARVEITSLRGIGYMLRASEAAL
ncbi:MAG: response regulator transcription factor [Bosea sp.]|uniref:response regulator transcription factor n=1 Tax=unclassified Bosea (in: a-proteobacteria) TaxID=2653178 RepID=UPI000967AADC|nr:MULTISPECIES: response regulator transcription factor [unclassified Bosea (in: a-proteobacteria)]MBN9442452.1 response regulator transcription factor [Bosea sp. (in: a-proteobacteria)]MBN9455358.1 response regulator transcription factor [Bosea sp. (in: a-proteobacteria)]OJV04971.1 MAG: DNA-binding response regulator [Bosea sp. 67-29]